MESVAALTLIVRFYHCPLCNSDWTARSTGEYFYAGASNRCPDCGSYGELINSRETLLTDIRRYHRHTLKLARGISSTENGHLQIVAPNFLKSTVWICPCGITYTGEQLAKKLLGRYGNPSITISTRDIAERG